MNKKTPTNCISNNSNDSLAFIRFNKLLVTLSPLSFWHYHYLNHISIHLLFVKSSSRFVGRFDRKSHEAQVVSNLVDKLVDLKLDELKREEMNRPDRLVHWIERRMICN